jgi:hypothetical protein
MRNLQERHFITDPGVVQRRTNRAGVVRDLTGSHSLRPLENRRRIRHQSANEEHQRGDAVWGMRWKGFAFSI